MFDFSNCESVMTSEYIARVLMPEQIRGWMNGCQFLLQLNFSL